MTGIYGPGKSTVWNTYVHQKRLYKSYRYCQV
ncbi:hypothetical protein [Streptococcus equi]|nr:hypothetical protein [Streptococcus equi]